VPPLPQSNTNRLLNRRVTALSPRQLEAHLWNKRRLRQETRRRTAMQLARVHQERMAQIHCSCCSRRCSLGQPRGVLFSKPGYLRIGMPRSPTGASNGGRASLSTNRDGREPGNSRQCANLYRPDRLDVEIGPRNLQDSLVASIGRHPPTRRKRRAVMPYSPLRETAPVQNLQASRLVASTSSCLPDRNLLPARESRAPRLRSAAKTRYLTL